MKIIMKDGYERNDAFVDGQLSWEQANILRNMADKIENGHDSGVIFDVNGNNVGRWEA